MGCFCQDKLGSGLRFCRSSLPLLPQTPLPPNLRMVVTEYNVMERAGPFKLSQTKPDHSQNCYSAAPALDYT